MRLRWSKAIGGGGATIGESVRFAPPGSGLIVAIIDDVAPNFIGLRTGDTRYRFLSRNAFGWSIGMSAHRFSDRIDGTAEETAWSGWLDALFD